MSQARGDVDFPEGWAEISFMELFDIEGGTQPAKSTFLYQPQEGYVRLLQIRDFGDKPVPTFIPDKASLRKCVETDILIGRYGASVGRICTGMKGAYNVALVKVRIPNSLDRRFVFFLLISELFQRPIVEIERSAQDGFNKGDLERIRLALPPLAEQKRIVAKVEEMLARVNAARQRLAKVPGILKRFRQSVLAAACSGRLTADWREESTDDGLPTDWEIRRLDSLFEVRTGGTPSRKNSAYFANGTIPWVKTSEVQNCEIFDTEEKITAAALENSSAKVFPPSTLLVALYGEGRTRGQIARLRIPAATNQACAALINPAMPEVTNRYVFIALLAAYHDLRGESAGGNQPNLSNGLIRMWEIPLPPIAEQHEIVRRVEALFRLADAIEKRVTGATARAEKLAQAILAKAFRGELVPTEAELARREGRSYEPASALLERIRAERAAITDGKRIPKKFPKPAKRA